MYLLKLINVGGRLCCFGLMFGYCIYAKPPNFRDISPLLAQLSPITYFIRSHEILKMGPKFIILDEAELVRQVRVNEDLRKEEIREFYKPNWE
jgi:hypothetical protein